MYDLIIVGIGPAGITAAIYAARYNMKTLIIGSKVGGMISMTHMIDNYTGLPSISGEELSEKMLNHLKKFDSCEIKIETVNSIRNNNGTVSVSTEDGEIYEGKNLLLALGTDKKKADIKGEADFLGKGLSYCTICDGMFFRNKITAVVGSGNSAIKGAHFLSNIAEKVYLIIRKGECSGSDKCELDEIITDPKVEIIKNSQVTEVFGNNKVEGIKLKTKNDDGSEVEKELKIDGLFIEIGTVPYSILLNGLGVDMNEAGFIKIDNNCKTNINNIYAAGDVTTGFSDLKQMIVAEAMGAIAATNIKKNLK